MIACVPLVSLVVTSCGSGDSNSDESKNVAVQVPPLPSSPPDPKTVVDLHAHSVSVVERARLRAPKHAKPVFDIAKTHERFGFDDQAISAYREALKIDPRLTNAYESIGFLLSQRKDRMEEAEEAYRAALALDGTRGGPRTRIGLILAHVGKVDEAIAQYEAEIKNGTDSGNTYYLLGQSLLVKEEFAKASQAYEECAKREPKHENVHYGLFQAYKALGRSEESKKALATFRENRKAATKRVEETTQRKTDRGEQLQLTAVAYLDAASTYAATGHPGEQRYAIDAAAVFDPTNADANFLIAERLREAGDIAKSFDHAKRAVESRPHHARALWLLAGLHLERQELLPAAKILARLVEIRPTHAEARSRFAYTILRTQLYGRESIAKALEHAKAAVESERNAKTLDVLAYALFLSGDKPAAVGSLEEAARLAPDDPKIRNRLQTIRNAP